MAVFPRRGVKHVVVFYTEEEYEILSYLPEDSVLFLCRFCRGAGDEEPTWKEAVNLYMQESFTKV